MAKIGIIMGSKSDYPVMKEATEILDDFGISYETEIVSAHRTPEKMMDYSKRILIMIIPMRIEQL